MRTVGPSPPTRGIICYRLEKAKGEQVSIKSFAPNLQTRLPDPVQSQSVLPAFPVDTHIFRVTRRLGWIPPNATVVQAHDLLAAFIPPRLYYRLHLNLIEHGRAICHAQKPQCEVCPLQSHCECYERRQK